MTTDEWRREWIALHERIARLETALQYSQASIERQLSSLVSRLDKHDTHSAQDRWMSTGAIIKILLAVTLPLMVLLLTGDKKAALHAVRLGLGG